MTRVGDKYKFVDLKEFKEKARADEAAGLCIRKQFILEEVKQEGEEDRILQFTISTGIVDRDSDTINPEGWKLAAYKANPVVLWAHDYYSPPIAKALATWIEDSKLKSRAQFTPRDLYPFGYMVYQMYREGFLNATSVGFMPHKWQFNEDRKFGIDFLEQELLEYSCVPVPANPEALIEARSKGIDTQPMLEWAEKVLDGHYGEKGLWVPRKAVEQIYSLLKPDKNVSIPEGGINKGTVPRDVSRETAPEDTEWEAPTLSDFTDQRWDDLSDAEKRRIAGHYAWAESMPPETFGALKLPHHRPSDGAVVWRGVAAAMGALLGARGGVDIPDDDRRPVYNHLASHYEQFDREPPEFRAYTQEELMKLFPELYEPTLELVVDSKTGMFEVLGPNRESLGFIRASDHYKGKFLESLDTKSGRVLSRANEDKLRQAVGLIQEVLSQLDSEPADEGEEPKDAGSDIDKSISDPSEPDEPILELADDETGNEGESKVEVDDKTVQELVRSAVAEALRAIIGKID